MNILLRSLLFIAAITIMAQPGSCPALAPPHPGGTVSPARQEKGNGMDRIVYTVLYNNVSKPNSILADHGFSCLLESGDRSLLFDAGRISEIFMRNVGQAGVDCSRIDAVFVSHIHDDHMGGLFDILAKCAKPKLYLPFSYPQMSGEPLGEQADRDFRALLDRLKPLVSEIVQKKEPAPVGDRFHSTGAIEDQTYEQALIVPTSRGLVILTGCAHPGILAIVRKAKEIMKQDVYFVMGGFHLVSTDSARVRAIAQELRNLTRYVGPCHCTGGNAQAVFKEIFKDDYVDVQAGMKFKIGEGRFK